MMSQFVERKKQKPGNVHMKMEPSPSYQLPEAMNTKELEFSQESHSERGENMNPRCYGCGVSPKKKFNTILTC